MPPAVGSAIEAAGIRLDVDVIDADLEDDLRRLGARREVEVGHAEVAGGLRTSEAVAEAFRQAGAAQTWITQVPRTKR